MISPPSFPQQVEGGARGGDQPLREPRWEAAAVSRSDHQDVGLEHQGGLQGESAAARLPSHATKVCLTRACTPVLL